MDPLSTSSVLLQKYDWKSITKIKGKSYFSWFYVVLNESGIIHVHRVQVLHSIECLCKITHS